MNSAVSTAKGLGLRTFSDFLVINANAVPTGRRIALPGKKAYKTIH